MEFLVLWLIFGFVAAVVANSRGANGCAAFAIGVLLGPLGIVIAFVMKPQNAVPVAVGGVLPMPPAATRLCPFCQSNIPGNASVCRYCQRESTPSRGVPPTCPSGRPHQWEPSARFPNYFGCPRCGAYERSPSGDVPLCTSGGQHNWKPSELRLGSWGCTRCGIYMEAPQQALGT